MSQLPPKDAQLEKWRQLEQDSRALVENNPDIVARFDRAFRHRYINPAIEKVTGVPAEQFLGKTNRELGMPPALCDTWEVALREVFRSGREQRIEFCFPALDGPRHYQARLVPELADDGTVESVLSAARDITERKHLEDDLRRSEEQFREAFDHAAIGKALVGLDGRWLQVNRSLCEIVGYSERELLAMTFQDVTHPEDLDADLAHTRQLLAGAIRYFHMEKRYRHKQGHIVWILLSVSLVHDGSGNPLYFIAQIQDISARKRAEQEREAVIRQLQEALATVKTLGELLPLCAWCKKIRNDQGYWSQLEAYLQEHLDLTFTHGICPACLEKMQSESPDHPCI